MKQIDDRSPGLIADLQNRLNSTTPPQFLELKVRCRFFLTQQSLIDKFASERKLLSALEVFKVVGLLLPSGLRARPSC